MDPLLQQLSAQLGVVDDNYFVYLLGMAVQAEALAAFERRRGISCEPCARSTVQRHARTQNSLHGIDFSGTTPMVEQPASLPSEPVQVAQAPMKSTEPVKSAPVGTLDAWESYVEDGARACIALLAVLSLTAAISGALTGLHSCSAL